MTVSLLLLASVLTQGLGIAAMRASDGLRRPGWLVVGFAAVAVSVWLMAQVLARGLSLAVGYGIWSGAGIALAALVGASVFGDTLRRPQVVGLALVLLGVLVVHGGGP